MWLDAFRTGGWVFKDHGFVRVPNLFIRHESQQPLCFSPGRRCICGILLRTCGNKPLLAPPISRRNGDLLSSQVFIEVYSYRRDRNKLALLRDTGLDRLALDHAEFLLLHRGTYGPKGNDANHHGFGGRAQAAQLTMGFGRVAENVVCCRSRSAATLVRLWSKSKAHELTMRAPYQYTGIGTVVANDGMVFSVEMFGERGSWSSGGFMRMKSF